MKGARSGSAGDRTRAAAGALRGYTLLELLVVVAIIALLAAMALGAATRVRSAVRSTACKSKLKLIAFEFIRFADESSHPDRGDSDKDGRAGFQIEDFQEKLYAVSEFWSAPGSARVDYVPSEQPLICPAGPQTLRSFANLPCNQYAVGPAQNVSIGFNKRLERATVKLGNWHILQPVWLRERILQHPQVPVAFDVDGSVASTRRVLPYYSAPPAGSPGPYSTGQLWFPSRRHEGQVNAGFVGGHVLSSRKPETSSGWNWRYQPPP